jgi:hypothetical protein
MEKRRWIDEDGQSKDGDFWLRQYQSLLDCRPSYLVQTDQALDPMLANHLVLAGVIHYLPFLARWVHSPQALQDVRDTMLKESGVTQSETRAAILKAVRLYLEERATVADKVHERLQTTGTHHRPESSAPPLEEMGEVGNVRSILVVECVVCMDEKCEIILVSCGHMCCCIRCAEKVTDCPMCRNVIEKKIRAILP